MRSFVVLLLLFDISLGKDATDIVYWDNIYKGDTEIPKNKKVADDKKWKQVDEEKDLNIKWYSQESDPTVQLAFDNKGVLAGTRLVIPTGIKENFYKNSKIFEEKTISGKPSYIATVIYTDIGVLKKHGGRRVTEDDEIVQLILVKHKDGKYEEIQRDACANAKPKVFVEQGCKNSYGLVFSPLNKKKNSCDYPFFLVYNEEQNVGELLGFGWLAPNINTKDTKKLTNEEIEKLFPDAPECLKDLTPVNIWLAKKEREEATCDEPIGQFIETRCQPKKRGGGDDNF